MITSPLIATFLNFRAVIDCTLHNAVIYDSKPKKLKQNEYNRVRATVFQQIHFTAYSVSPIPGVDTAGNEGKQEHDSSACLKAIFRSKVIHIIIEYNLPVDAVNAASDDTEQNCQHNVSVFHHRFPHFPIVTAQ